MAPLRILFKNVTKDGRINGLNELAGEDVYLIPKPRLRLPAEKLPEDARRILDDVQAYVKAHAELARRQANEFREKNSKTLALDDLRKDVEEAVKVAREEIAMVGGRVRGVARKTVGTVSKNGEETPEVAAAASTNGHKAE